MIDSLHIGNFKAFAAHTGGGTIEIPLRPITLIFGRNSSGKSTLLQALLTLQQAWEQPGALPDDLVLEGSRVRLGTFLNILHGQNPDRTLRLGLRLGKQVVDLEFEPVGHGGRGRLKALEIEVDGLAEARMMRLRFIALARGRDERDVVHLGLDGAWLAPAATAPGDVAHVEATPNQQNAANAAARLLLGALGIATAHGSQFLRMSIRWSPDRFDVSVEAGDLVPTTPPAEQSFELRWTPAALHLRDSRESRSPGRAAGTIIDEGTDNIRGSSPSAAPLNSDLGQEGTRALVGSSTPEQPVDPATALRTRLRPHLESVVVAAAACGRIRHVGRTRVWQDRRFSCSPTPEDDVGESGAATASVLWHFPEILQTVNNWLVDRLECPLRCDVERWDATGTDATIRLSPVKPKQDPESKDTKKDQAQENVRVGLPDVGSGVSQILPVLVQFALADPRLAHNAERPGMVVLVQQPELHLHPRMQVLFARLLVDLVTEWDRHLAVERRPDHLRPQVILETHSKELVESFVNDIAAMEDDSGAEGAQSSTALHRLISLIYVSQVGGAARVKEITINRNGDFEDEWPDGFFTRRAIFGPSTRGGV